jgi:hypothetical protein
MAGPRESESCTRKARVRELCLQKRSLAPRKEASARIQTMRVSNERSGRRLDAILLTMELFFFGAFEFEVRSGYATSEAAKVLA